MNTYQVALPAGASILIVAENYYVDSNGLRFVDQFDKTVNAYPPGQYLSVALVNSTTAGTVASNQYQATNVDAITGDPLS